MKYTLTITGDAKDQAALEKTADVMLAAIRAVATAELAIDYPPDVPDPPTKSGPIDFAKEPVAVVIDLTDQGPIVSVSARDGALEATAATVDDAMAAVAAKAVETPIAAQPDGAAIAAKEITQ